MKYPLGFYSFGKNIGIKDESLDFAVIYSQQICKAAAVFTKNNFPGAPILVGRDHIKSGKLQAIVINSKNSNVATGDKGIEDARKTCEVLGESLGIDPKSILPSSTGVIGVPLPIDKILKACSEAKDNLKEGNLEEVANAILTTDKVSKISFREISFNGKSGVIYGMAKGAGMIEPNMATMLCYILSDWDSEEDLYSELKSCVDETFNCLSIDTDTSTSDTVVLMSSGKAGVLPSAIFRKALHEICLDLTKKIAMDGEGATKLIIVKVESAKNDTQAIKIGKSILNSPLVKTAIYGGDPNWGRLVMAIGKVFDEPIPYENLEIFFGELSVKEADNEQKVLLSTYLKENSEIHVTVKLGMGNSSKEFYGCDFTEGYIQENAYYTT